MFKTRFISMLVLLAVFSFLGARAQEAACPAPTNLAVTPESIAAREATVTWEGTSDSYVVMIGQENFAVSADFEDGNMPAGWDASQGNNNWYVDTQDYWGHAPAYSGTYSLYVDGNGAYKDDYFISPALKFAGAGSVSFAYATPSWSGDQNNLTVAYSTSPTGPWINTSFVNQTSENWTTATVDLSALNGTYYIAFISYDSYGYCTAIDNINITFTTADAPTTYTVTLKEGTDDATSWQGKAGEGEYQALPLEGVAAGTAVTVKYDGRKKVKSVTIEKADPLAVPLTLEALTAGNIVLDIMEIGGKGGGVYPGSSKGGPGRRGSSNISMTYSVNGGEKTTIYETTTIDVNAGDKVQLYGNGPDISNYCVPQIAGGTAQVKVYGNIMSMLDEDNYATLTTLQDFAFYGLFFGNENLTDASGLLLPATTLAGVCYFGMFNGCTSLTTAPALPATELAGQCYYYMFGGCTSLTTAPALPATELAWQCYFGMFYGCTSLTTAPALPATELALGCYNYMFSGCTSLTTAPALPATTLAEGCYYSMFYGCTGLTTAPTLPATTLAGGCYGSMFSGCTSLTTAPALPATTLAYSCYSSMFDGCTSLVTAPALPATTLTEYCYRSMFSGCTSLTTAPVLPAETLVSNCYRQMFNGCTSLNSVTCMATDISADGCTTGWLDGIATSGTFITPASTGWGDGASGIPTGWTRVDPNAFVPLTMEALSDGTVVVNNPQSGMQYSLNGGAKAPVTSEAISVTASDKVQFYGNGTSINNYNGTTIAGGTAQVKVYGNIMSLIDETGYATLTTLPNQDYVFYGLFKNNANLTDASGLLLPATTLAGMCYYSMFSGCTSLTAAPVLPATTLANYCYDQMFSGCTSLTTAPALPATTLANYCYANMFQGCTSLTAAPALPATTLAEACYYSMFSGCTSLTAAPTLPAATLADYCYSDMFAGCTSLTTAPVLPATTLTEYCYRSMFQGCTSLTTAPALPATTLTASCYFCMFSGCTSLTTAPALPATTLANYCYYKMFNGCTSLTTAPVLPATTLANHCYRGMFQGCTSLTTAPVLPATTLANYCYRSMFQGCTSLNSVTCMATNITASYCTTGWLHGVAATGTFTKASGAYWPTGNNGIPEGWTVNEQ